MVGEIPVVVAQGVQVLLSGQAMPQRLESGHRGEMEDVAGQRQGIRPQGPRLGEQPVKDLPHRDPAWGAFPEIGLEMEGGLAGRMRVARIGLRQVGVAQLHHHHLPLQALDEDLVFRRVIGVQVAAAHRATPARPRGTAVGAGIS